MIDRKPRRTFEAGLARVIMDIEHNRVSRGRNVEDLTAAIRGGCVDDENVMSTSNETSSVDPSNIKHMTSNMVSGNRGSTEASAAPTLKPNSTANAPPPIESKSEEAKQKPSALPNITVDNDLVMECLAEQISSKFVISLYDFGGQSVFNVVHPFFLTRCGVYLVVFNMEWIRGFS